MGDMKEYFSDWKEHKQKQHADWKTNNLAIIDKWLKLNNINSVMRPESILFRNHGKPKVDFYPSTGRWRDLTNNETYSGGAEKFIRWYENDNQN